MKIKYNNPKNTFRAFSEANYVVYNKKKFLDGSSKKIKNLYCGPIVTTIILFVVVIVFNFEDKIIEELINILFFCSYIYLIIILTFYNIYKKNLKDGVFMVDKKGITDISDIIVTFPWDTVRLIGVTKNMMVIISDNPSLVFLIEPNEKLMDEILKYKEVKIIRND